ncbi:hypothetical protein H5410_061738 [Solanum commersonii]|uniref:Uncharacterized protein n=1 Tax=Solanum commersonii TaxID=4109 RepID=A0A9J5W9P4_SOLCO|nr:hypothetical protein H5410_061738 [Solanum commersonii]
MSQNSVNIVEVHFNCDDYYRLKILRTPLNSSYKFKNNGCAYFRWISPSPENVDFQSSKLVSCLMNRIFKAGKKLNNRLKGKLKEFEAKKDYLKLKLNENEEKMMEVN